MNQSRVVGIGFFGRPQTFSKIFSKILESYSLGPDDAMELCKKFDTMAAGLPDFIMTEGYAATAERKIDLQTETNRITGFYVSFIDNGPNLSVVTRISGKMLNRCCCGLAPFMELRKGRLN